jgi:hypothetical protein
VTFRGWALRNTTELRCQKQCDIYLPYLRWQYCSNYLCLLLGSHIYRVIRNDCRYFNNLPYTIHYRQQYMYFLCNITTLPVYVTYLTCALYVHRMWLYKHQHDNPVRSKLFVACQPIHRFGKCWFKNSPTCRWKWKFLDPSVQLHTAIWSVLCVTSCWNVDNHFE